MVIKKFAEIDDNSIVTAIRDYPTEEGWIAPSFLVEIDPYADIVQGDIYEDGTFRHITIEEIQAQARPGFDAQRNALFAITTWVRERHSDLKDLAIDDKTKWTAWLNYWQALRNMPAQPGFDPANPVWPTQPK